MTKNKVLTIGVAFLVGFGLTFLANAVLAINIGTAPLEFEGLSPSVHSLDVAGGFNDADGDGVSIQNSGKTSIKSNNLPGSFGYPQNYALTINSNRGGMRALSVNQPVFGYSPDGTGRIGIEAMLRFKNLSDVSSWAHSYLGYIKNQSGSYFPFEPIAPSDNPKPYAFYTAYDTYLGDTVTVDGALSNSSGTIDVISDVEVQGHLDITGNLSTNVMNFQNTNPTPNNLDSKFIITQDTKVSTTTGINFGDRFSEAVSCPVGTYLVGCSGWVDGAEQFAPYRGAEKSANGCKAWARKAEDSAMFFLHVYAYCFDPS